MEEPTPAPQTPKAGYTPVPLREGSDYRPPRLTIWRSGCTCTSASHSLEPTSGNCLTQVPGQTQDTLLRPRVNPARTVGPGPVSPSGAARSATPRPPRCRAGERAEAQGPGTRSPPAPGTAPHHCPHPVGPLSGDSLPELSAFPAQDAQPAWPAPCSSPTHAQYLPGGHASAFLFSPGSLLGGPPLYTTPPFKGPEIHCLTPGTSGVINLVTNRRVETSEEESRPINSSPLDEKRNPPPALCQWIYLAFKKVNLSSASPERVADSQPVTFNFNLFKYEYRITSFLFCQIKTISTHTLEINYYFLIYRQHCSIKIHLNSKSIGEIRSQIKERSLKWIELCLFLLFLLKKDEHFQDRLVFRGTTVDNVGPRTQILCLLGPMVKKIEGGSTPENVPGRR